MQLKISSKLIELRKQLHLSQEELAEKLGVSRQAISKWECDETLPDTDNLLALAKMYDISLDWLFEMKPADTQTPEDYAQKYPQVYKNQKEDTVLLYNALFDLIAKNGHVKLSLVQRELKIGFSRAGRMIDNLLQLDIIYCDGNKGYCLVESEN